MFKKILVLLILITFVSHSQIWNDIKTTNINLSSAQYAEMFSNGFGNNVILQNNNGSIIYYFVNASTGLAGSPVPVESNSSSLAQITGEAQKVYVLYKKNNKIVTRFTTNAGVNWSSSIPDLNVNPNSLDVVSYDGKIHITYSLNNIVYYYQYNGSIWTNPCNVSSSETGTNPRIEVLTTQNKVYVVYNNGDNAKSREYIIDDNQWDHIRTLHSNVNYSNIAGFGVDANYIYLYYSSIYNISPDFYYIFNTRKIQKSDYTTVSLSWEEYNLTQFVQTTTTSDNKVHSAYGWYGIFPGDGYQSFQLEPGLIHDYFNNGTRNAENIEVNYNYDNYYNVEISSTSNDLFVIWKPATSNMMKYRQYDAFPLAPTNPLLSANPGNGMILFTWRRNEADISVYEVWRKVTELGGIWQLISTTSNNYFVDPTYYYAPGAGNFGLTYKVRAKDFGNHLSSYSSEVSTRGEEMGKQNVTNYSQLDISLDQNYPNPFNPSTKISYTIKEEGLITLKIYDILGKEIVTLVNESKPEGFYEAEFNASQLPSGMYIYKLQAGSFTDVKKMLLMK